MTSSIPASAATARAVASLSPVSRIGCSPSARSSATAAAAESLTVSATAIAPRTAPSQPTSTAVRPACSHRRHWRVSSPSTVIPCSASSRARPMTTSRPSTLPRAPSPGSARNASASGSGPHSVPRGRADRRRDRVLGGLLDRTRVPEQVGPGDAVGRLRADQRHPAGGDGPGLVENHHVDRARGLERLVLLDEYPAARAPPGRRHECGGRRQAERARARDDQHREPGAERVPGRGPGQQPAREGGHGADRAPRARTRRRSGRPPAGSPPSAPGPARPG